MRFFTLYKFELKKIIFMVFPAVFIMFFLGVLDLDVSLFNMLNYSYIDPFGQIDIYSGISFLNLLWIVIMAFVQFKSFSLKERGSLPFNQSTLFLAHFLSGATIIAAAILFYIVAGGAEFIKYSFMFKSVESIISPPAVYINGLGIFLLSAFSIFLIMLAAYLCAVIFMLLFKNIIFSVVLYIVFFVTLADFWGNIYNPLKILGIFSWFSRDLIGRLNIISCTFGSTESTFWLIQAIKLLYLVSAVIMLYSISSLSFFGISDKGRSILAKNIFGDIIMFLTVVFTAFDIIYSSLFNYYSISEPSTAGILAISILIGAAAEAAAILLNKKLNKGGWKK